MRVCLLTSAPFPPGEGLGYHVWNLARQLTRRGHRVSIITRGRMARTTREEREGVTIWRPPFAPIYPFHVHLHGYYVNRLLRQMAGEFDVVNAHTPLPPAIRTSLPLVTTFHSPMRSDTARTVAGGLHGLLVRLQTPISQGIETALVRRSQRVSAVAGWVAEELRPYGVDPDQVVVTGNGMEDAFLESSALPLPRESFILSVGRLQVGKGVEELIEAARLVEGTRPGVGLRYVIVGDGPLRANLEEQARRAGLSDCVQFVGQIGADQRPALAALYRRAGMFVLSSHHEGMPTVLLEAMAAGAPVISTAVGGALEVIRDGENGLLTPARAPHALADAILRLAEDEALAARLGCAGRESVRRRYSWDAVSEQYLACYRQAINGKG
jgi:glycosyltransferase involved in cell wall biosynthesis